MKISKKLACMIMVCGVMVTHGASAAAEDIVSALAGSSFYCSGGNESSGRDYYFKAGSGYISRIDQRFPGKEVVFNIGSANKGQLGDYWSYETLSDTRGGRVHLYERVSMRSPKQSRHIYTTYELYKNDDEITMVLYNGVSGARDWTHKTTRECGRKVGNKIIGKGNRYWSTTFAK
nr:hypothetical protein [uncultured Cohaesibacter sp.]